MALIQATIHVSEDGRVTGKVSATVPLGDYQVPIGISKPPHQAEEAWELPVDDCGPWPENVARGDLW